MDQGTRQKEFPQCCGILPRRKRLCHGRAGNKNSIDVLPQGVVLARETNHQLVPIAARVCRADEPDMMGRTKKMEELGVKMRAPR